MCLDNVVHGRLYWILVVGTPEKPTSIYRSRRVKIIPSYYRLLKPFVVARDTETSLDQKLIASTVDWHSSRR